MPDKELGTVNGVTSTMTIDVSSLVTAMKLDPTLATGRARLRYPENGALITSIKGPGDAPVTVSFPPAQRQQYTEVLRARPSDGVQVLVQTAPTWILETA